MIFGKNGLGLSKGVVAIAFDMVRQAHQPLRQRYNFFWKSPYQKSPKVIRQLRENNIPKILLTPCFDKLNNRVSGDFIFQQLPYHYFISGGDIRRGFIVNVFGLSSSSAILHVFNFASNWVPCNTTNIASKSTAGESICT